MSQIAESGKTTIARRLLWWQLITMEVGHFGGRHDPIPTALAAVRGVSAVARDPASGRVWVFGDGSVEPEALVNALASWGYGSCVLENQFEKPV